MRVVFLTVDYPEALQSTYAGSWTDVTGKTYAELYTHSRAALFSPGMAEALCVLGHDAIDVRVNNLPLQRAWRAENVGHRFGFRHQARRFGFGLRRVASRGRAAVHYVTTGSQLPSLPDSRFDARNPEIKEIVADQIFHLRPDVVYNFDPVAIDGKFLAGLKSHFGALVAQIAAPVPPTMDWSDYDLVISSLPNYVASFTQRGISAAYLPLFFVPRILEEVPPAPRDLKLTFVGSVTRAHGGRREFLMRMAETLPLALFGSLHGETGSSPLASAYRGPAWGRGMFAVLARSRLTLNRHIDVAMGYANNMRLYEATGMGACLVTERAPNLADLFEPGSEVVAYEDIEECISLCRFYAAHKAKAETIARAGQRRCLTDHNVERRSEQLIALLRARL
jgi:spore maturation protein CgeB